MTYQPTQELLDKYADVLVKFALNSGKGIKKGEIVFIQVSECAKPFLISLRRSVLKAGGHPIIQYSPDDIAREFYEIGTDEQINFFPEKLLKGRIDEIDHLISIISDTNPKELEGIDPKKIMSRNKAFKPYMDYRDEKENKGKFTWTLALYGTEAMAKEANLTLEEYWEQIIKACFLDEKDPVKKWKEIFKETERIREKLNSLPIKTLHITGKNIDLKVGIDKNRKWLGGSGRNIPSFELFISPDWRKTQGKIKFNQPLYRYGNIIKDIELEFKDGQVIKSKASQNEKVLKEMIATENADKIGEFSLTDKRMSKITKFMAETLFDENIGGEFGNSHIALGNAYQDSYIGDPSKITKEQWEEMGYNSSSVHTDIINTEDKTVRATLEDGKEVVIYKSGEFLV